jgi:hypothetical protein
MAVLTARACARQVFEKMAAMFPNQAGVAPPGAAQ